MPRVWSRRPDVKLLIAGKNPPRSLHALAESANPVSGDKPAVTVTGSVPDMRPYLSRATISVAPLLYGAGIQNKVLEAMACATPVIASPGAASALTAKNGRDLLVANDPESFAREIMDLLANDSRRNELGSAGRVYAETHHNWDEIGGLLESAYQKAMANGKLLRARRSSPNTIYRSRVLYRL